MKRSSPRNNQHAKLFAKPKRRRFAFGKAFALLLLLGCIVVAFLLSQMWQMLQNTAPNQDTTPNASSNASDIWQASAVPKPNNLSLTPDVNPEADDIREDANRRRQAAAAAALRPHASSDPLAGAVPLDPMAPIHPTNTGGAQTVHPTNVERKLNPINNQTTPAESQQQELRPLPAQPKDNGPIDNLY